MATLQWCQRQQLNEDEIAAILEHEDYFSLKDTNSEEEDCLIEDDVSSEIEDEVVDYWSDKHSTNSLEEDLGNPNSS